MSQAQTNEGTGLLSFPAAARRLGISPKTLDRWARQADFPFDVLTLGSRVRKLKVAELDRFVGTA